MVEQRQLEFREASRAKRIKAMDKVRPNIPPVAFDMPLEELELADDINNALKSVANVGELMVRLQADEEALSQLLITSNAGADAMDAIKEAIASLVLSRPQQPAKAEPGGRRSSRQTGARTRRRNPGSSRQKWQPPAEAEACRNCREMRTKKRRPPSSMRNARSRRPRFKAPTVRRVPKPVEPEPEVVAAVDAEVDDDDDDEKKKKGGKKGKNQRRELVFDERRGEVVSKRKRKGGRARTWGDFEE